VWICSAFCSYHEALLDNMPSLNFHFSTKIGKTFHFIVRMVMVLLLALATTGSLIIFIISIVQENYPNAGDAFPSSSSEHFCCNNLNTPCGEPDYASHLPLRFMSTNDSSLPYRYEYCPWLQSHNTWRCVSSFFIAILAMIMLTVLGRRTPASTTSAIWENPKRVLKFSFIPTVLSAFAYLVLLIADGIAVTNSSSWCSQLASQMAAQGSPIVCDYDTFNLVVILDAIEFLFWGIILMLLFVRKTKYFLKYQQLDEYEDDDDEYRMDEVSSTRSQLREKVNKAREKQKKGGRLTRL